MCGRFTLRTPLNLLMEAFGVESAGGVQLELFGPRYNVAPTQQVVAVRQTDADGRRELAELRWGLIPSWSRDPAKGPPLINARGETIAEKPSFRTAFKRRRCLLPADGFYEWQSEGSGKSKSKQPYLIHYPDDRPFAFAALWESWRDKDDPDQVVESCTIVTTSAEGAMTEIHHRMPVILDERDHALWLDPNIEDAEELLPLVAPHEYPELAADPVSTYVNRVKNDDPQCIARQTRLF